jgi:thioredoxin 1
MVEAANLVPVGDETFDREVLQADKPVVVDFWAEWCGPCRMIAPAIEELANQYTGQVKVAKFDVDSNPKTPTKYGIRSIPTVLFFKEGKLVEQVVGAVPKSYLESKLKGVLYKTAD